MDIDPVHSVEITLLAYLVINKIICDIRDALKDD